MVNGEREKIEAIRMEREAKLENEAKKCAEQGGINAIPDPD